MTKDNETTTAQAPVLKSKANPPRLHFGRLRLAEQVRTLHYADIPAGLKLEDVMKPAFWAHYTREMRPNDLIETVCEDGTWEALLRVMFISTAEVVLSKVYHVVHDKASADEMSTDVHEIKWISPQVKYAVVRKDNGTVIKDHLYPKDQAIAYLQQHMKSIAA